VFRLGVVAWLVGGPVSERLATPGVAGSPLSCGGWCGVVRAVRRRRLVLRPAPGSPGRAWAGGAKWRSVAAVRGRGLLHLEWARWPGQALRRAQAVA